MAKRQAPRTRPAYIQERSVWVYGTIAIADGNKLTLVAGVDYEDGRYKVPGGKVSQVKGTDEYVECAEAMSSKFYKETGLKVVFSREDLFNESNRRKQEELQNDKYYFKVVEASSIERDLSDVYWGTNAGLAYLPIPSANELADVPEDKLKSYLPFSLLFTCYGMSSLPGSVEVRKSRSGFFSYNYRFAFMLFGLATACRPELKKYLDNVITQDHKTVFCKYIAPWLLPTFPEFPNTSNVETQEPEEEQPEIILIHINKTTRNWNRSRGIGCSHIVLKINPQTGIFVLPNLTDLVISSNHPVNDLGMFGNFHATQYTCENVDEFLEIRRDNYGSQLIFLPFNERKSEKRKTYTFPNNLRQLKKELIFVAENIIDAMLDCINKQLLQEK